MSSCERYLYYFVSDVHLGLGAYDAPAREERFVKFLRGVPPEIKALYLLGDIFDYWFEYKYVVPKGFTRVLGALSHWLIMGGARFF
jgi:UDP-2,3-diacylglucosamine hydrolase